MDFLGHVLNPFGREWQKDQGEIFRESRRGPRGGVILKFPFSFSSSSKNEWLARWGLLHPSGGLPKSLENAGLLHEPIGALPGRSKFPSFVPDSPFKRGVFPPNSLTNHLSFLVLGSLPISPPSPQFCHLGF